MAVIILPANFLWHSTKVASIMEKYQFYGSFWLKDLPFEFSKVLTISYDTIASITKCKRP